jgi:hypothetical protein
MAANKTTSNQNISEIVELDNFSESDYEVNEDDENTRIDANYKNKLNKIKKNNNIKQDEILNALLIVHEKDLQKISLLKNFIKKLENTNQYMKIKVSSLQSRFTELSDIAKDNLVIIKSNRKNNLRSKIFLGLSILLNIYLIICFIYITNHKL